MDDQFMFGADAHEAWARIRQMRKCPSMARLRAGGPAVRAHVAACHDCRKRYWEMLNHPAYSGIFPAILQTEAPERGQIRKIMEDAGYYPNDCWDDELFSPPLVVIVKESPLDFVRVAQIHDEPALAGPGDIPMRMPAGTRFAESWNVYPMLTEFLGPVLYRISPGIVGRIIAAESRPLPEVPPDSPLEAFRELEVEVGYHYSQLSVAASLERMETGEKPAARITHFPSQRFAPSPYDMPEDTKLAEFIRKRCVRESIGDEWGKAEGSVRRYFDPLSQNAPSRKESGWVMPDSAFKRSLERIATSGDERIFIDSLTRTQVRIHGAWAFLVNGSKQICLRFMDKSGKPVTLRKEGLGKRMKAYEGNISNADESDFVCLNPGDTLELELKGESDVAGIRYFTD